MARHTQDFRTYALEDRYALTEGRVFLTGTQALVRIMLDQARRDRAAGLDTAGFISGYRGSPLGGLDLELWRAEERLREDRITFMPAVNEDLGATLVLGAQQSTLDPAAEVEGNRLTRRDRDIRKHDARTRGSLAEIGLDRLQVGVAVRQPALRAAGVI